MKIFITTTKNNLDTDRPYIGEALIKNGFIHACTVELAHQIIDKFDKKDLYQVWLDTDLLEAKVLFEDKNNNNLFFPHIYGLINTSAIIDILPMDKNEVLERKNHFKKASYF